MDIEDNNLVVENFVTGCDGDDFTEFHTNTNKLKYLLRRILDLSNI